MRPIVRKRMSVRLVGLLACATVASLAILPMRTDHALRAGSVPDSRAGTVNKGAGEITDVLFINGRPRVAGVQSGDTIEVALASAPLGPIPARYLLWIWRGEVFNPQVLSQGGTPIGCTVNPTPLHAGASPQPKACMFGGRVPARLCGRTELSGPARAPWRLRGRLGNDCDTIVLTLQGLLEDDGSAHPSGISVTNAVTVVITPPPCSDCCGGGYFH